MLSCTKVSKSFGSHQVLRDVDLKIAEGKITCLIGPSGSGKTTLLRALSFLEYPDAGKITSGDAAHYFPLTTLAPAPWPDVTVVFQSLFLWPHLTLRENILLPARNRIKDEAALQSALNDLITAFDMGAFIDRFPSEASLGQRQRVAIARACILKPQYVLFDEITSSLDVEQIEKVLDHLLLLKAQGVGVFIITHLLGFARRAADHIYFMADGQILEDGPPAMLQAPKNDRFQRFLKTLEAAS